MLTVVRIVWILVWTSVFTSGAGWASSSFPLSRLRIMTFNVFGVPLPFQDPSRFADSGRALRARFEAGLDVVLLQEMFHPETARLIEAAGFPYALRETGRLSGARGSGLVILSRYPIQRIQSQWFSRCVSWDCLAAKAVQLAKVQVGPHEVYLANTHLNSNLVGDPSSDPESPSDVRIQQLQEIREFLWDQVPSHAPLVFGGDFNLRSIDFEYSLLLDGIGLRSSLVDCLELGTSRCQAEANLPQVARDTIDHVLYRSGRSPRIELIPTGFRRYFWETVHGRRLSDHLAIEMSFDLLTDLGAGRK